MPTSSPDRRKTVALALVSLVAVVLLVWIVDRTTAARPASASQTDPAIPVTASTVGTMNLPLYLTGVGAVAPLYDVTVKSQVDGQIVKVNFREGQYVHSGDVLVEIDRRALQATVDQASAKLDQDRATLANARLELTRHQQLAQVNATSTQALEAQQALVNELNAQIRGDQAALQNARVSVDYTTIRAPISGRIGFRLVDQGNLVRANETALLTLVTTSPITVIYSASQDALPAIQKALHRGPVDAVALTTDGNTVLSRGHLEVIENRVAAATGVIRLKALFANGDGALWPGQSIMMRTKVDVLPDVTVVPEDAIQQGADGAFVFVVEVDDKVVVQPVKVSQRSLGYAAIASGLKVGQRVVVQGQYRLQGGARVAATMMPAAHALDDVVASATVATDAH
ncbi:efflux RND transporter periplasmic adaptor subunit [Paraburkholderia acidicola]|uniref:Efflux RND transporter periplasmic adaptor subunit n=1 Tax=Paraburkholderia acidicola TaxID=1912599 RepID=A0ABV1LT51_9BURK